MFTDRQIRNLKPDTKTKDIRGGRGFGIRIRPDGTKIFFYAYDSPVTGRRRFLTLGQYPDLSLEKAHILHGDAYKVVKSGGDPLEVKQQEQEERKKAPTVADLGCEYLNKHARRFKKSWKEDERILNREVLPAWGNRKAGEVVKRDVVQLLERIIDRGSPGMANNSFQVIRKMFNFAVERDILPFSPCNGIKLPAPKTSRDRVLSEEEIKTFWHGLECCGISPATKLALKLVLVTAQRPGEVIGLHTDEIDGEWWTILATRSKNGKAHRVPLSRLARAIIDEAIAEVKEARGLPAEEEYRGFIFPSPHRKKEQSIARRALSCAVWRHIPLEERPATDTELPLVHFTPHDLRRTAATRMAEAGEMDEVIDAIMNHAKQGVIRVYNLYKYDAQKRRALESWATKIQAIISK